MQNFNFIVYTVRDPVPLSEMLIKTLANYKVEKKYVISIIKNNWEQLVGSYIAEQTLSLDIRKRILYINIKSGVIKYELSLQSEELMKRINELFPYPVINQIVV
ncbi:MAG TPA: DUF721 domain-containing protein [Bacteroidales bacterium]|nr:DUF721 domain-containing protein [Bacteroidales bacterium]